jgi:hypothetical protein
MQYHVAVLTTINFAKLIFAGTATDAFTFFAVGVSVYQFGNFGTAAKTTASD